jgi:hypothetical protein
MAAMDSLAARRAPLLAVLAAAAALALALIGAPQARAAACTTTWTSTNGVWNNPLNWDSGVPDASDVACIQGTADVQVVIQAQSGNEVNATATAKELHLGGTSGTQTILISGETLSATDHDASLTLVGGVGSASDIAGSGKIQIQRGSGANASICAVSPLTNSGTIQTLGALGPSRILGGSIKNQGTLQLDIDTTVPSSGCGTGASSLENNGGNIAIGGSRTLDVAGSYLQSSGTTSSTGNGALSAGAGGSLTVTGGSVTGNAVVDGGSLAASGGSGTFDLSGNSALSSNVGPNVTVNAVGGTPGDTTVTTSGGPLTNDGTINLTSVNFTNGARLRGSSGSPITNTGAIAVDALGELGGTIDNQGDLSIDGDAASESGPNALALTNSSGGTLTVNATLDDSGNVLTVSGGTLKGDGTVKAATVTNNGGTVHPGNSPGVLTVNGNYVQGSGGTLAIEIQGPDPASQYSRLVVTGNATLGGTLKVTTTGTQSGALQILQAPQVNGNFATKNFTGQTWGVSKSSTDVKLVTKPVNTTKPSIAGTPRVGNTLTCNIGVWNTPGSGTFAYRWRRDGVPLAAATAKRKVVAADQGHKLTCRVTATNAAGSTSATSNPVTVPREPVQRGSFPKKSLRATKLGNVDVPIRNPNPLAAGGKLVLRNAKGKVVGRADFQIAKRSTHLIKIPLGKGVFAKLKAKGQLKLGATLVLSKGAVKRTTKATLTINAPKP